MDYKRLNIILAWVVWAVATVTYVSTMEPTTSFWDCGEFILTAYRLEVGHPPGAPLFLMIGRVFSLLGSPENAAYFVNLVSALSSSFTILFLFWTISYLAKKIATLENQEFTSARQMAVLGSALVGSLAYTFSDTFWFSAVEAEVYAMSSLFTAIVFWAILRWDAVADEPQSNRWLIFIAYMMGLSVGVHLLNLLAIPALTFVYYFRKYNPTPKGVAITAVISIAILGFIQKGIIPGVVKIASYFELIFVNGMGLPFNSGNYIYLVLLVGGVVYGIYYTHKHRKVLANTVLLFLSVILIGYSSYSMIMIRSSANPPMDENNPENVFSLLSYLNREQYGSQPLAYGPYFNAPLDANKPYVDGKPVYQPDEEKGEYIIIDDRKGSVPNYDDRFKTVFPRMWSTEAHHVRAYKQWSDFEGTRERVRTAQGTKTIQKPTFGENLTFFWNHQVRWMYFRYLFWNFVGRQNDVQGHGDIVNGNWLSGIDFIDNKMLGPQENLPPYQADNKARNSFYFFPLILGLIGLIYQLNRSRRSFLVVALLFFFTGLAIILYLNQYPYQPRERDYAYAGSFYAFAIWIGFGVYALFDLISRQLKKETGALALALTMLFVVIVPGLMAAEGWDDHDRSDRYTARDFARAYLDSCAPNAILFTNGDNDTFPVWYVQEVEGYRTDVRVVNLSLLNTDWYIDQMLRKAYDSEPVPFSMENRQYRQGTRDYLPAIDMNKGGNYIDVKRVVDFFSDDQKKQTMQNGRQMNIVPTKKFSIKVDKEKVLASGYIPDEKDSVLVDEIQWSVGDKNYFLKKDLMMLDLLAHFNWDRPIYFAITTGNSAYLGLDEYFQLEGLAYRLVPYKARSSDGQTGYVNTDVMYDNLMNKFQYGNLHAEGIYANDDIRRMVMNFRNNFARLAAALQVKGETERAKEVLARCIEVFPHENVPYNYFMVPVVEMMYRTGMIEQAKEVTTVLYEDMKTELDYYFKLDKEMYNDYNQNARQALSVIYQLQSLTTTHMPEDEMSKELQGDLEAYEKQLRAKQGV